MPKLEAYDTLDIKYRPKFFKDIIGQDRIINYLKKRLKAGKIPRTIMLHGCTGVGKTTLARLIAKYVNCTGETFACGKCYTCKCKNIKDHVDVHEMNMANATSVDDVRNLISKARYLPRTNFRVYILDELHMCSPQAKECILKPLEEPPAHVIWILCTTEIEKFKDTILNRCTSLHLRDVQPEDLAEYLITVAEKEKSPLAQDRELMLDLAYASHACPRESLKLLDSIITHMTTENIKTVDKKKILEFVRDGNPEQYVINYLMAIYRGSYKEAFTILKETQKEHKTEYLMREIIKYHKNILYNSIDETLDNRFFVNLTDEYLSAKNKKYHLSRPALAKMLVCMVKAYSEARNYLVSVDSLAASLTVEILDISREDFIQKALAQKAKSKKK